MADVNSSLACSKAKALSQLCLLGKMLCSPHTTLPLGFLLAVTLNTKSSLCQRQKSLSVHRLNTAPQRR